MNSTFCPDLIHNDPLCFIPTRYPFYYSPRPRLFDGVADHLLTLAAPVVAYWVLSLFFHCLDISEWKWLDKYRIHDSAEVKSKNLATRAEVVWAVVLQQVIQTLLGLAVLPDESMHGVNHPERLRQIATDIEPVLAILFQSRVGPLLLTRVTEFLYWWGIPAVQFLGAMYVRFPP